MLRILAITILLLAGWPPLTLYGASPEQPATQVIQQDIAFRFDGSDLMPGGVGAGSFWTGMVDYAGGKDAAAVAGEIQDSWDALK